MVETLLCLLIRCVCIFNWIACVLWNTLYKTEAFKFFSNFMWNDCANTYFHKVLIICTSHVKLRLCPFEPVFFRLIIFIMISLNNNSTHWNWISKWFIDLSKLIKIWIKIFFREIDAKIHKLIHPSNKFTINLMRWKIEIKLNKIWK